MVHIEDYLPLRLKKIDQIRDFCIAEDPLFERIEKLSLKWLKNTGPLDSDEDGLVLWEKLLSITPTPDEDLDERRFAVQAAFAKRLPYTWITVNRYAETLCGKGNYTLTRPSPFTMKIRLEMDSFNNMGTVISAIEEIIPAHILIEGEQVLKYDPSEVDIATAGFIKGLYETPVNMEEYKKPLTAKTYIGIPLVTSYIYETPLYN